MQLSALALVSALASTAFAGTAVVYNSCGSNIYLTTTDSSQQSTTTTIGPNGSTSATISGSGNSWGVSTNMDFYSSTTPKLIWGFTDTAPTLYYSVSTVDGNPFSSFSLSTTDSTCPVITSANGSTVTCGDGATFTLNVAC